MINARLFNEKSLPVFTLLICIFLSIFLIFSSENEKVQSFRIYTADKFSFLYQPFNWIDNQSFLMKRIEVLASENLKLNLENQILSSNELENKRLRAFLDFKAKRDHNFIGSDVISKGTSSNLNAFLINQGSNSGVKKNDPVLSSKGVIGKIIAVSDDHSSVQLISDGNFRLSVKIMPSESEGIMRWKNNQICEIFEVKKTAEVNIGDIVLTSDLSSYFPPNLPVGEVVSIYDKSDSFNKIVRLELYTDLSTINQLFIIIDENRK
jgi:rod shape-determining protein MreC|tara:strand:+ start:45 stop:839 length:795 start_codon:yes stop_codon:yes gene_type:complete